MDTPETRRQRAQLIVNELSLTVAANRFAMPARQLSDMLAGRKSFGEKVARRMEQAFNSSLPQGWLDTPIGDADTPKNQDGVQLSALGTTHSPTDIVIPQYETGGSMGPGIVLVDQPGVIKEWRVSERWLQLNVQQVTSPKNLCIVTGFGPSMQPLYNPGDPLLIDQGIKRVEIDGIYFFRIGEEGYVKQLQRIPTPQGLVIRAKSYNHLYDPFDIIEGMDFEVFGRVLKVWKGEDF